MIFQNNEISKDKTIKQIRRVDKIGSFIPKKDMTKILGGKNTKSSKWNMRCGDLLPQ